MILLIGRNGNLSKAIQYYFLSEDIHVVGSEVSNQWVTSTSNEDIEVYLDNLKEKPNIVLYASGIIDPRAPLKDLLNINFHLPRMLEEISFKRNFKLVTFGTIMEKFDAIAESNPYIFSKRQYLDYLLQSGHSKSNTLHLQIHTWYGGDSLKPFMFLGQMYSAIQKREVFRMSSGGQLREYHHIHDDLSVLKSLLGFDANGVIEINHGETITLKALAEYVFSNFDLSNLLQIGTLPSPEQEIFRIEYSPSGHLKVENFRKTLPGVVEYFKLLEGIQR